MDNQMVTQLILIHLAAAFDTADHQTLCRMMEDSFRITLKALEWITSYLHHRLQHVIIGTSTGSRGASSILSSPYHVYAILQPDLQCH